MSYDKLNKYKINKKLFYNIIKFKFYHKNDHYY